MDESAFDGVPETLVRVAARHGQAVAAGDDATTLADFRPDRIGQLLGSARLPDDLVGSELLRIRPERDGRYAAFIEYTGSAGGRTTLRSRWIEQGGTWLVTEVRNLPETPPLFGTEGPAPDGVDAPHWEGARDGVLRMQRCANCRTWIWSPRPICPACHSFDLDWPAVEPAGTLFSWTRTWQPFAPGATGHLPYVIVVVEIPAAGHRRLVGVLRDADGVEPRIGQRLRGEFDRSLLRWRVA